MPKKDDATTVHVTIKDLPKPTADLVISITLLEMFRETNGQRWCDDTLIGMLRRKLGRPQAARHVVSDIDRATNAARVLLGEVCGRCPHGCRMKVW